MGPRERAPRGLARTWSTPAPDQIGREESPRQPLLEQQIDLPLADISERLTVTSGYARR